MSIYAIGDLHLSFTTDKPMDIFGPDWHDHVSTLKENWDEVVEEGDTVIIPGDISWGLRLDEAQADLKWIHELKGHKILIRGNHDLWWSSISKLNALYDDITFIQNNHYPIGDIAICGTRGWIVPNDPDFTEHDEKIYNREIGRLELSLSSARDAGFSDIIVAIHYPPAIDENHITGFIEKLEEYGVKQVVYGHLHGKEAFKNGIRGLVNGIEYDLVSFDYLNGGLRKLR